MRRFQVINHLINLYGYTKYLEIGVSRGKSFEKIKIVDKDGVDPNGNCNFVMKSDDFFKTNKKIYDIIFIDGLHIASQVIRDIENSLKFLSKNGIIVVHDCNPKRYHHQLEEKPESGVWNGTVWMAFLTLRTTRSDLYMKCVNSDNGIGLIKRGSQETLKLDPKKIDYQSFRRYKKEILNLISVEEFLKEFK